MRRKKLSIYSLVPFCLSPSFSVLSLSHFTKTALKLASLSRDALSLAMLSLRLTSHVSLSCSLTNTSRKIQSQKNLTFGCGDGGDGV